MRTFVAVLALFVASIASALPQPASRCSHDTFADGGKTVAVTETFRNASTSFSDATSIEVLAGASISRSVHDVSLAPLGLQYTLHLTLAYREAAVSIEHALLLPGAVPLK